MDDPDIAERLVNALVLPDGNPYLRPVHAIGIGATGFFVASEVARDFCVAEHFQGEQIPGRGALLERIRAARFSTTAGRTCAAWRRDFTSPTAPRPISSR